MRSSLVTRSPLAFSSLLTAVLPVASLLAACGGSDSGAATSSDSKGDAGPAVADSGGDAAADAAPLGDASTPSLCDGQPGVRFSYQSGGGFISPVENLLETNGSSYWFIDGSCHYWAMTSVSFDVHEGVLTADQAAGLAGDLEISRWPAWAAEPGGGCADGGQVSLRAPGASLTFVPCGASDAPAAMQRAVSARLAKAYAAGTPVAGAVRYLLLRGGDSSPWSAADTARARPWPLATDPETVARGLNDTSAPLALAAPPDADALRGLRRALPNDVAGSGAPILGPATDGGSAHYRLFVRDTISLEDASGKVTF